ncbi:MAG: glycosyltransferase family 2 protein [Anaerolineales bacterium]
MKPDCSIVIRTYNEEQHIGRLLSGILKQTLEDIEVVIVDSGSTDATRSIASRYPVTIVSIDPSEFTFGRSLNFGCEETRAEVIVIASAHVYPVYVDWLEQLLAPFEDDNIWMTYGSQRGGETTRFSERQQFRKLFPEVSDWDQGHPLCNNANAAIRREAWVRNHYDETLPGLEDIAWAKWALGQGGKLAYVAEAEIVHVHDESPLQVFNRYRREAMALRRIRPDERFNLVDFVRLFTANVVSDLGQAAKDGGLSRYASDILSFRFSQFWGTYSGFSYAGDLTNELKQAFYYPANSTAINTTSQRAVEHVHYETSELDTTKERT